MGLFDKKHVFRHMLPIFCMTAGGAMAIKYIVDIRYKYQNTNVDIRAEAAKSGVKMKEAGEVTIETEYEKIRKLDLDKWENKRIPRPWDEEAEAKQIL